MFGSQLLMFELWNLSNVRFVRVGELNVRARSMPEILLFNPSLIFRIWFVFVLIFELLCFARARQRRKPYFSVKSQRSVSDIFRGFLIPKRPQSATVFLTWGQIKGTILYLGSVSFSLLFSASLFEFQGSEVHDGGDNLIDAQFLLRFESQDIHATLENVPKYQLYWMYNLIKEKVIFIRCYVKIKASKVFAITLRSRVIRLTYISCFHLLHLIHAFNLGEAHALVRKILPFVGEKQFFCQNINKINQQPKQFLSIYITTATIYPNFSAVSFESKERLWKYA